MKDHKAMCRSYGIAKPEPKPKKVVWGLAAGRGTTKEAARGAFTTREYEGEVPAADWLDIIGIEERV